MGDLSLGGFTAILVPAMKRSLLLILLTLSFLLAGSNEVYAYIDPGTGGYLIGSILAMIGGFFAFASAFVIHFFRSTIGGWIKFMWRKFGVFFIAAVVAVIVGIVWWVFGVFYGPPPSKFDADVPGAHVDNASEVCPGYNLYEGKLIDNNGKVVKTWPSTYLGVIDKNGDYYAQKYFEAPVWGRYTWDGKAIWEKDFPVHHEILLTPSGTILTLTKETREYQGRMVDFDVILEFDKDGKELQRFSFWEHLADLQKHHSKLELDTPPNVLIPASRRKEKSVWGGDYDYYNVNSLSLVPLTRLNGKHPAFRPGNWVISMGHGSMVFILDQDTKQVLWRAIYDQVKDKLEGPNAPCALPSGNVLLFDNGRYRKWSRVVEIDPVTLDVAWEYRCPKFYTLSQGYVQKLPNGNMLVTEGDEGYVFELTPGKKTVWEFYNPDILNEKNSADKNKLGVRRETYRMTRYPKDMIERFLYEGR